MKIIFLGSAQFAVASLQALINAGEDLLCVVTQPDKKKGRGLLMAPTAVKEEALKSGIKVYQPENVNTEESVEYLRSLKPDLLVIVAYGQILSQDILDIPAISPINLHASLLPQYRGAAPINWAIIKGEKTTGVTIMKVIKAMDSGPIISRKETVISFAENAEDLTKRLAAMGAHLLLDAVGSIKSGKSTLIEQDNAKSSYAPKLKKNHGLINWQSSKVEIYNLIRGCYPWPSAFTYYNEKVIKILKAEFVEGASLGKFSPGEVVKISKEGIEIAAADGNLLIRELQPEGKRKMSAYDFILGHKVKVGDIFN